MWLPVQQQCSQVQAPGGPDAGNILSPCRLWRQGGLLRQGSGSLISVIEEAKRPYLRRLRLQALMTTLGKLIRSCGSLRHHFCGRPQLQWYCAAGSDDKVVLLYELKGGKAVAAFGSSDGPNRENWRVGKQMRGHDGQVGPRQATAALPADL